MIDAKTGLKGKSGSPVPKTSPGSVTVYCLAALVIEEARRHGCPGFAAAMEKTLAALLAGLPRQDQQEALRLSYEMALAGEEPAPPRLRLVYSRT